MHDLHLVQDTHYASRGRAHELAVFIDSASYFSALYTAIAAAERRILIVGWSLDDRIRLVRGGADERTLGELLVHRARENPSLRIQLRIWQAPAVFAADQHITAWFEGETRKLANLELVRVPAESAFAARHEKYVIIDDALAFLGGIDLSHNRWDTADHHGVHPARTNPDGEPYVPYHDVQLMFSGPAVRDLFTVAVGDGLISDNWDPPGDSDTARELWPPGVPVDLRDEELLFSVTRSHPDSTENDGTDSEAYLRHIAHLYRDVVRAAEERIYIENQYFSSDEITEALTAHLENPEGPEVIIIVPRELPDALGRVTMGVNTTVQLARLISHDRHRRLGVFHRVSADDTAADIKVHSKTMIVDGELITVGSANISRRSFSLDSELNATIRGVGTVEDRLLAQHTGLDLEEWRSRVTQHRGSRLSAMYERSEEWSGLEDGRDQIVANAPRHVPKDVLERFDMEQPPPQETVFQRIVRSNPWEIITRTKRVWVTSLVAVMVIGGLFYAARSDFDIRTVLQSIEEINNQRPLLGVFLTIGAFWLTMGAFVTIVVPIVFFSALHGPLLGIIYSTVGIFSGAAIFYGIGLALHNSPWPDRYQAVRRAKGQLERIKPYGLWAVAISRMVPSGPFLVVNLVTGLLGFSPWQFLAGSAVGLLPGIVAFSIFGEVIRNVFTDPGIMSTIWFVLFIVVYFAAVRGLLSIVRRIAAWVSGDSKE
ncbi:MAG: VTT domain-containing protein [Alkalispirochaeta sp.]